MVTYTVCVDEHKTGKSERAKLVLDKDIFSLLTKWMTVRKAVIPQACPYVFPNFRGERLTDLTSIVNTFASKKGYSLPTSRVVRTAVEVKATCLPPAEKQAIARSLSHSTDTAEKHYRALDRGKTMLAYRSVGSILGVTAAVPNTQVPATPKRRFFSAEETALVMEGFQAHITRKVLPSIDEAQAFLDKYVPKGLFQGRKPHDIYDKIRNIIGRKQLKK